MLNFGFLKIDCVLRSVNQVCLGLDNVNLNFRDFRSQIGVLVSAFEDGVLKVHRLNYILWIQDIVHAHDYVLGNPHRRIRGIDMYPFRSSSPQETDLISEEQAQLLYILYLDVNWSRNGNLSLPVRFILLLTKLID